MLTVWGARCKEPPLSQNVLDASASRNSNQQLTLVLPPSRVSKPNVDRYALAVSVDLGPISVRIFCAWRLKRYAVDDRMPVSGLNRVACCIVILKLYALRRYIMCRHVDRCLLTCLHAYVLQHAFD